MVNGIHVPRKYQEPMAAGQAEYWQAACEEEMKSLDSHDTYEIVDLPHGAKIIPSKWVFDVKTNETGSVKVWGTRKLADPWCEL